MESIANWMRLGDVVRLVGLNDPGPPIRVELASNSSSRARAVSPWIAGFARQDSVVIFSLTLAQLSGPLAG